CVCVCVCVCVSLPLTGNTHTHSPTHTHAYTLTNTHINTHTHTLSLFSDTHTHTHLQKYLLHVRIQKLKHTQIFPHTYVWFVFLSLVTHPQKTHNISLFLFLSLSPTVLT